MIRSTATVGGLTFISRVLGFVRDMVIARMFGAGAMTDAFFVAFRIPNLLRRFFAEGSFALAFVPVLSEYRSQRDRAEIKQLIDRVAGTLLSVLLVVVGLGVLLAPWVTSLFAGGFRDDPEQFQLATDMLRVTFPYLLFIAMTAFCGAILNTWRRFAIPAVTPVLLNITLIVSAIWGSEHFDVPIKALAWGVLAAGIIQLAVQVPALARMGLLPRPRLCFADSGVRRIGKLMIPTLVGSSVAQVNVLVDTMIASYLMAGSVSWLYYADRLMEFPLGVFAIALSTVILPGLSSLYAEDRKRDFYDMLDRAMRIGVLIGMPAALGLLLLARPILHTLFGYGEFGSGDVEMAALALGAYSLGLPAYMGVKILAPAFYARQDTRTPMRVAVIAMVSNMLLNGVFVALLLWQTEVPAHVGLALASAASSYINVGMLYWYLRHRSHYSPRAGWGRFLLRIALALLAMALVLWLGQQWLQGRPEGILARVLNLAALIGGGAASYFLVLLACGWRPGQHRLQHREG